MKSGQIQLLPASVRTAWSFQVEVAIHAADSRGPFIILRSGNDLTKIRSSVLRLTKPVSTFLIRPQISRAVSRGHGLWNL